jgi:hypothetical protein
MALRPDAMSAVFVGAVVFLGCGVALAATDYPDRVGDVRREAAPDIASVRVSNTVTTVTFSVRFVKAPPLRTSRNPGWVDMLLVGIDVPPVGPPPVAPGGEWVGADFAIGTHGPSRTGRMVRLGREIPAKPRHVATMAIVTHRSTLTLSIPRRALGTPTWFRFSVAAAREKRGDESGGAVDVAPAQGTYRYVLTG